MWSSLLVRLILSAFLACFYYFLVIFSSQFLAFICRLGFTFFPSTGFQFPWSSLPVHRFPFLFANNIFNVISVHIGWASTVYNHRSHPWQKTSCSTAPNITIHSSSCRISYVPLYAAVPDVSRAICLSLVTSLFPKQPTRLMFFLSSNYTSKMALSIAMAQGTARV